MGLGQPERAHSSQMEQLYALYSFCASASCDLVGVTFPMIHVVTWYKQEVNRVFEQEVNLVLVDVLPVSC